MTLMRAKVFNYVDRIDAVRIMESSSGIHYLAIIIRNIVEYIINKERPLGLLFTLNFNGVAALIRRCWPKNRVCIGNSKGHNVTSMITAVVQKADDLRHHIGLLYNLFL